MNQYLYTVSEAAKLLKLHPKTLRRKIQSGEISSTRVGKQYRLSGEQLRDYCGGDLEFSHQTTSTRRRVLVSTVIDIHAISEDDSTRISNYLMASQKNAEPGFESKRLRIDSIYERDIGYLKILITGENSVVRDLMKLVDSLLSSK